MALLGVSILLPIAVCVTLGLASLLGAMGDAMGARVLVYVGWALGASWVVSLIMLILVAAGRALRENDDDQPAAEKAASDDPGG